MSWLVGITGSEQWHWFLLMVFQHTLAGCLVPCFVGGKKGSWLQISLCVVMVMMAGWWCVMKQSSRFFAQGANGQWCLCNIICLKYRSNIFLLSGSSIYGDVNNTKGHGIVSLDLCWRLYVSDWDYMGQMVDIYHATSTHEAQRKRNMIQF